jgi:hypothetical protein
VEVRVAVVGGATSLSPVCVVSVASCLVEPVVAASRIVKVNVCRGPRDQRGGNNDLSCEHGAFASSASRRCLWGGWVARRKGREGVVARPTMCPHLQITSRWWHKTASK